LARIIGSCDKLTSPNALKCSQTMTRDRLLLIPLLLWGLAMIAPDLLRVVQPLGSFGFYANNDGLIYDITGPFGDDKSSPAWQAGLRDGDRIDLPSLHCTVNHLSACGNAVGALGGVQFVLSGSAITLDIAGAEGKPSRQVTLHARRIPSNILVRGVILLDQIAAILVVVGAAWLVWSRPSAMTWGFFLYVNWFNPAQSYAYYAILQQWPPLLIAQDIAGCVAQAAGFAGLLLFVIRAPNDRTEPRWQPVQRALPFVAAAFAAVLIASYGSLFGYPTETLTRVGIAAGFVVAVCAVAILMARMQSQKPEDYQRLRWVLWGCLIGLPSFLIAELAAETTVFETALGFTMPGDMIGLLYLVNGVLCLFVFEAVRSDHVVSVWIPLRRVTILAFILTPAALFLHSQVQRVETYFELPAWAWLVLAVVVSFLISLLHDKAVEFADAFFNRSLDRIEHQLAEALHNARTPTEIEQVLADETSRALHLTSAASFRRQGSVLSREGEGMGWDECGRELKPEEPILIHLNEGVPFRIKRTQTEGLDVPKGLGRPVLAVPSANAARCFAVSLYGPHVSGTYLDHNERAMLGRLANDAAAAYAELENGELRQKVASLEHELAAAKARTGATTA
jgi:hypothetical protein